MGRKRKHNLHLPRGMSCERGAYYLRTATKRTPLGRDFAAAMAMYGRLMHAHWVGTTVGDILTRYLTEVTPVKRSETTRADEKRSIERLAKVFGAMRPGDLTVQHAYRYLDLRRDAAGKAVPIAARHEVGLLRAALNKAVRWGAIDRNPLTQIELPAVPRRTRYVSDAEFAAARELASDRLQVAMDLALLTGLRQGDILGLTRSNLTAEGIEVTASKTGKAAVITWTPELQAAVARAKALAPQLGSPYLVRNREGQRYSASGFASLWQALMRRYKAAGGEVFQFKDIRAKTASDSASLAEASERLQHSTTAITSARYMRKAARIKPLR
jgi:integrase